MVDGFDGNLRRQEDTDLNLRLALNGVHFAGLSRPLVEQTVTITADKAVDEEHRHSLQLIEKHKNLLERWAWYDFSRDWIEMKYALLADNKLGALTRLTRLLVTSPVKTTQKVRWALPNRNTYKRYEFQEHSVHDVSGKS
jgi:hypothetical protein